MHKKRFGKYARPVPETAADRAERERIRKIRVGQQKQKSTVHEIEGALHYKISNATYRNKRVNAKRDR